MAFLSFKSKRLRVLAFTFLAVVALVAAIVIVAPAAIRQVGESALRDAGFAEADITGIRLSGFGIALERVSLAAESRFVAEEVRIDFSWKSMAAASADRVTIGRMRLDAAIDAEGQLHLPAYRPPPRAIDEISLPFRILRLEWAEMRLATPLGPAGLEGRAFILRNGPDGLTFDGRLSGRHANGSLEGRLDGDIDFAEDGLRIAFVAEGGAVRYAGIGTEALTGTFDLEIDETGRPAADLTLAADTVRWAEDREGTARLSTSLRGDRVEFSAYVEAGAGAGLVLEGESDLVRRTARMTARIAADGLAEAGKFRRGSIDLEAEVDIDSERVVATFERPLRLSAEPDAILLPEAAAAYFGRPIEVTLRPAPGHSAMSFVFDLERKSLEAAAALTVVAGDSRVRMMAQSMRLALDDAAVASAAAELRVDAEGVQWGDLKVGLEGYAGRLHYAAASGWTLAGAGNIHLSGMVGPLSLGVLRLDWSGRVEADRSAIRLLNSGCLPLAAEFVRLRSTEIRTPHLPCLDSPVAEALATFGLDRSVASVSLVLPNSPVELVVRGEDSETRVSGSAPAIQFEAKFSAEGLDTGRARSSGGELLLDRPQLAVAGIEGDFALDSRGLAGATLRVAEIRDQTTPAFLVPFGLEGSARREEEMLGFDAVLSDNLGIVVFEVTGQAGDGRGRADMTLYPIGFIPEAVEIGDLSPLLGTVLEGATGTVAFNGTLEWEGAVIESAGEATVDDVSASLSTARLSGLDSTVRFASLVPPITDGVQGVAIRELDAGLLLTEGRIAFALDAGGRLDVSRLRFGLAGGEVSADPFIVDLSAPGDLRLALRAENVDLAQMFDVSGIDGLDGEGTLTGRVPVLLSAEGVRIDEGVLEAATSGILRYMPENPPAFLQGNDLRSQMLRQALGNFHYDALSLQLSGDIGEEQQVALRARGSNPDFLDGHPVELNFNIAGPLVSVLRSAVGVTGSRALEEMFRKQQDEEEESPEMKP